MSLARRHYDRATAGAAAGQAKAGAQQTGDAYNLHMSALYEARRTLKGIMSIKGKIEKKREMLPEFLPYVDGVIAEGKGAQDDVLATMLVWCVDAGELEKALEIGAYAVKHSIETPDHFDRDTVSMMAEEIAEAVRKMIEDPDAGDENDSAALVEIMQRLAEIVGDHDMHDPVKAKLHKAHGYALRENGETAEAIAQLKEALSLNERAGVKKDIEQLEKQQKQSKPEQQNAADQPQG